ncbi:MAG TPA: hypothetical protein VFZ98_09955 [Vicinamibacterales bacterium]
MATGLFTPVLNDRTRAPYFFNGRLLTGEAMTDEQRAQRVAHELLAQGLGDGVVSGLQVALSIALNSVDRPVVTVKAGAAISRLGDLLVLPEDTDVELVRPAHQSAAPQKIFDACKPPQQGTYVADAGVYLLTIAPIGVGNGLAPVSGLGTTTQSCNVKYRVDAVEFRLVELPVAKEILDDSNRMRNRIAYACFGVDETAFFARDPLGTASEPQTLLDDVDGKTITGCDVPLAVLYWTATGGVLFLDMWSVRRRVTHSRAATRFPALSDKRLAVSEAAMLQFQEQIGGLRSTFGQAATLLASDHFRFLPPVGVLPIATLASTGLSVDAFFAGLTVGPQTNQAPAFVEGSRLQGIVHEALPYFPIDTRTLELIWLYSIRENRQAIHQGVAGMSGPAVVFVTGHAPYRADAHFDVAKWDYATYV